MRTYNLSIGAKTTKIIIGEKIENIQQYFSVEKTVVIADTNVLKLYQNYLPNNIRIIEVEPIEANKTIETALKIFNELLNLKFDKFSTILGFGGGLVCDIAGFIASTFMRGVTFGFIHTTLVAQVDASIGGKNGLNFNGYKNIIGTINQADFILIETSFLATLDKNNFLGGLSEVIKHTLIADKNMFSFLEKNTKTILSNDFVAIEKLIYNSIIIKSEIVIKDEKEKGERRKLNFGHTIAHAIEKSNQLPHGMAVSIGICAEAYFSFKNGLLPENDLNRIVSVIKNFGLPTKTEVPFTQLIEHIKFDKKRQDNTIHIALLNGIGNAVVERVQLADLDEFMINQDQQTE